VSGARGPISLHAGDPPLPEAAARILTLVERTVRAGLARTGGRGVPAMLAGDAATRRAGDHASSGLAPDPEATALLLVALGDALDDPTRTRIRATLGLAPGTDADAPRTCLAGHTTALRPWIVPSVALHAAIAADDVAALRALADRYRGDVPDGSPGLAAVATLRALDELATATSDGALHAAIDARLDAWCETLPAPGRVDRVAAVALLTTVAVARGRMDRALALLPHLARRIDPAGTLDPALGADAPRAVPVLLVLEALVRAGVGVREGARTLWPVAEAPARAAGIRRGSAATARPWVPRVGLVDDGADRGDETGTGEVLAGLARAGEVEVVPLTRVDGTRVRLEATDAVDVVIDTWLGSATATAAAFHDAMRRSGRPVVRVLCPAHLRTGGPGRVRSRTFEVLRDAVTRADVVVAPGRHLAQWAVDAGARDVVLIPPAVTAEPPPRGRGWRGRIAIPGADAPASDLARLPAIVAALERADGVGPLTWISLGPPPPGLEGRTVVVHDVTDGIRAADLDLALLPLDAGSGLPGRSLQPVRRLAAAGIPLVTSPGAGVEALLRPGHEVLVVGDDGWEDAVRDLRDDPRRAAIARAAWDRIHASHPPERAGRLWLRVLRVAREIAGGWADAPMSGPRRDRGRDPAPEPRAGDDPYAGTGTATR